ncbi:MAG: hypothetical protein R6U17_00145 [Thermoplasmata archaeon]
MIGKTTSSIGRDEALKSVYNVIIFFVVMMLVIFFISSQVNRYKYRVALSGPEEEVTVILPFVARYSKDGVLEGLSDLRNDIKVTEGTAEWEIVETEHGPGLEITFSGDIILEAYHEQSISRKTGRYYTFSSFSMETEPYSRTHSIYSSYGNISVRIEAVRESLRASPYHELNLSMEVEQLNEGWHEYER